MPQAVGSWDRSFRIWAYSVSHSTLLLRGLDAERDPRRIDIVFLGVRAIHLRDEYRSFTLEKAEDLGGTGVLRIEHEAAEPVARYVVNGGPDYVIATNVAWHEDDGDHRTPSRFGPLRGTP